MLTIPIKPVLMSNKVCSKFISEGYLFYDDNEYIASKSQLYTRIYRAKMHNGTKSYWYMQRLITQQYFLIFFIKRIWVPTPARTYSKI